MLKPAAIFLALGLAFAGAGAAPVHSPVLRVPPWAQPGASASSGSGLLIQNGLVYDGTGAPPRRADLRVVGDRIGDVAPSLEPRAGERVIDASGLAVAPGFVDSHSHADRGLGDHPDAAAHVLQGITTAITGQDGGGELPVSDFVERVERLQPAINVATLVGHGSVRSLVLGGDYRRAADAREIEVMQALVDRAMRDGALGLSSGLEYDPGFYATPDELVALARVAAGYGGYYSTHVRDEENEVVAAWREALDVGRRAKLPVVISHAKVAVKGMWGKADAVLRELDAAARDGVRAIADWYPYRYWQSAMYVLIPDRDFENRERWRVGLDEIGGAANVLVTSYRPDPALNGRTLAQIADTWGKDPVTTVIEMVRAAGPDIGIIGTSMTEPDLERIFAHPRVVVCSDGALGGRHPRAYGAFPRVLGRYVRERRVVSLEEAIAKMTSRTAAQAGLIDRGRLVAGAYADVVIFDAATIADRGTPERPSDPPVGLRWVIVNGEVVLEEGARTAARPGRVIRRR